MPRKITMMEVRKLIGDIAAGITQDNVKIQTDYAHDPELFSIIQNGQSVLWVRVKENGEVKFSLPNT